MKKIFTLISFVVAGTAFVSAQNEKSVAVQSDNSSEASEFIDLSMSPFAESKFEPNMASLLYDNGPIINMPGQGFGGADASSLHDGMRVLGWGCAVAQGLRLADDFTVPAGETWTIDSIIVFNYQTGSTTTSTINDVRVCIRNADPLTAPQTTSVIWGDSTTNIMDNTYFSNIYRTSSTSVTATNRPVMKTSAITVGLVVPAGKHWVDYQTAGTGASGPWTPSITFPTQMITGDALVTDGTGLWDVLLDTAAAGTSDDSQQGIPFLVYGTINSGVNELYANNNVSVYPNPMTASSTVSVSDKIVKSSAGYSFVVYDLLGNMVRNTTSIASNKFTIHKGDLSTGVYVYEVINGNEIIKRGKLSIQ